jgi:predicted acylesterase/phospholipase RssA/CRP-like cAMP-binding protein
MNVPELSAFLADVPFFAALDEPTRQEVAEQLVPVHAGAGEVICKQGDTGDGLFVVVSGRLRVSVAADRADRMLYDLGRGAIVGEMALLTDRPRAATVRAVRDSDLLLLRVSSFRSLIERSPALMSGIMRLLIDRLLTVDQLLAVERPRVPSLAARTIAVTPAGQAGSPGPDRLAAMVAGQLAQELAGMGSVFLVDADVVTRQLGPGSAQRGPGEPGRAELTEWLHAVERSHDRVIYQPDQGDTPWSRLCLSQSDVALLVAPADGDPAIGGAEARALAMGSLRCELVLLHPGQPSGTASWLRDRPVADHHHLRAGRAGDVARLARMLTGTGCGLVLGGGGALGFAHLGVLRALEENSVPIDVIGGTSIGAIMAALYALELDHEERVKRTALNNRRLMTPTLPLVSVSSGRRVDRLIADYLGDIPIEDLPVRFFCVSASLGDAEEVIHERGPLGHGVRASVSLPGIFPPVYADGHLLIDGGALNNVPADVMRERVGSGCVIAVSLSQGAGPLTVPSFEPGLSGWRVLGRRINPFAESMRIPGIAEILTRSTGLSQLRNRRAALVDDSVDLLLRPPAAGFGTMNFKDGVALMETGYRYTIEQLERSGLAKSFAGVSART